MSTLTIITAKDYLNHHYRVSNVGIGNERFYFVLENKEIDDFLTEFLTGETGYPIQINADTLYLKTKCPCVVEMSNKIDELTAFSVKMVVEN